LPATHRSFNPTKDEPLDAALFIVATEHAGALHDAV
jgi:hypothetical protein